MLWKIVILVVLVGVACLFLFFPSRPEESGATHICFSQQQGCEEIWFSFFESEVLGCALYDIDEEYLQPLIQNNISLLIDSHNDQGYGQPIYSKGLMHHKFCFNKTHVLMGSLNPTKRGFQKNDNVLLVMQSKLLAENYAKEFVNVKKVQHKKTPYQEIIFNSYPVENYFCPRDGCKEKVIETLQQANTSILFLLFSFTDDDIGNLLVEKAKYIDVRGVTERSQLNDFAEYHRLKDSLNIRLDENPANMHHKIFIIDNQTVIVGSYNPTKNANENNRENMLIFHDPLIATFFLTEFDRIW